MRLRRLQAQHPCGDARMVEGPREWRVTDLHPHEHARGDGDDIRQLDLCVRAHGNICPPGSAEKESHMALERHDLSSRRALGEPHTDEISHPCLHNREHAHSGQKPVVTHIGCAGHDDAARLPSPARVIFTRLSVRREKFVDLRLMVHRSLPRGNARGELKRGSACCQPLLSRGEGSSVASVPWKALPVKEARQIFARLRPWER